jgi:predicted unusual protein kinase regulating ubiquinone biosynthesis (AarF/ABC1/UbiB family)
LQRIALDIFILRNIAKFVRRFKKTNSNLPVLIDEWAGSIYREMSYVNELKNAQEFASLFSHYPEVRHAPAHIALACCVLLHSAVDRKCDHTCFTL